MSHTDAQPDPRSPPARRCSSSPAGSPRPGARSRPSLRSRELSIFLVLVAVVVLATSKNNSFLFSSDGWRNFLLNPSILVLLAVGQGVVIITRNVDLSVGSVMALTAYLTGRLFIDHPGLPIVAVIAACLLLGAVLGLVNGLLVAYGKVPALVITLGTLYIYRGIMLTWAGSDRINAGDLPREFLRLGTRSVARRPGADHHRGASSWPRSATTSTPPAVAASSTPSGPTRTPRSSTDCPYAVACSPRSSSAARWPVSPAPSTPRATAR